MDKKNAATWDYLEENKSRLQKHISINDDSLHAKFTYILIEILHFCRFYNLKNLVKKYEKISKEIDDAQDKDQFVIDLSLKYSQYQFKPHLYADYPRLLIKIAELEFYYKVIGDKAKERKVSMPVRNKQTKNQVRRRLPRWINKEFKSIIKQEYDLKDVQRRIKLDHPTLYEEFSQAVVSVLVECERYKMKKTNHVYVKYQKMRDDIFKAEDKNQLVKNLAMSSDFYKFDPCLFRYKPKLIRPIFVLEMYFKELSEQISVERRKLLKKLIK
ncbi:7691_t:CDS:1 [Dentiscutata erythropus]|uniref:7691_t:CDS:1 n=1 Tax=Dentiscutata erythropus TaxID=1348616 RepID=A0A9N9DLG6_9GLOM|nr:7691_t:CDS:1 [Dentiscutata erythropus]